MDVNFPDSVHVDSVVASLVGRSFMVEENILKDGPDKKVDSSQEKAYAGVQLASRSGLHGTYVSQSLLSDFKTLFSMQEGGSYTELLESIEQQAEFLSDIAFNSMRASTLFCGALVVANRSLYLKGWNTDTAQYYKDLRLPFTESPLLGTSWGEVASSV
ncbi:hypothetical protein NDU88_003856 [Pleurodeles waltl]|uniref:Uncharacterized protein n=1 Tax=Pleurodeles waltl TaxID=8319 RepID=A0AAV7RIM2_PLEWA|nr:hypothetical protein NDU88_003856 [Pleurodeles waltl]